MTRSRQNDWTEIGLGIVLATLVLIGVAFSLTGCTAGELDSVDSPVPSGPCVPSNQYWCGDGSGSCCYPSRPVCGGRRPGFYCASDVAVDDNGEPAFGAAKPKRWRRIPGSK